MIDNTEGRNMIEQIVVYDEQLNKTGIEDRNTVHLNGNWHYVSHCWVYNKSRNEIVLQRRAADKSLFPKRYDVSCAGHYSSEDTFKSVRELEEELGIKTSYEQLIYLRDFKDIFKANEIYDREVARVHLLIVDEFDPKPTTPEEIDSIAVCDLDDFIALIAGATSHISIKTVLGEATNKILTGQMLVPREFPYYQNIFALIQSHITNL